MQYPRPFFPALLIQGLLALLCLHSWAGYPPMVPPLQPYRVVSPEGTWRLDVKPGNREGAGPASTVLTNTKTGEIAWKQMLPYTFWQCCVNDDGIVGGYAYSKGVMGEGQWDSSKHPGDFLIHILDVEGAPIYEETTRREPSSVGMGYYQPTHCAHRLLLDAGNDRMVVQMNSGSLRCYSMQSRSIESVFNPAIWPDEIQFIPKTRFMLFQNNSAWSTGNGAGTYKSESKSSIQLIDDQGLTLWEVKHSQTFGPEFNGPFPKFRILEINPETKQEDVPDPVAPVDPFAESPDPFAQAESDPKMEGPNAPVDPFAEPDPSTQADSRPKVEPDLSAQSDSKPKVEEPPKTSSAPEFHEVASFEVYLENTGEKVTVRILKGEDSARQDVYQIVEKSREKWTPPVEKVKPDADIPPVDFPVIQPILRSSIQLNGPNGAALAHITSVAIGPNETIHALDQDSAQVHVFDRNGKLMHTCTVEKRYAISKTLAVNDQGEVFVQISEDRSPPEDKSASLVGRCLRFSVKGNLENGTIGPFWAELIVQPKTSNMISIGDKEIAVDSLSGDYSWRSSTLTHRADGQWLDYIKNVACAPDGSIAVRDESRGNSFGGFTTPFPLLPRHLPADTIAIYSPDGKPIRTIDFSLYPGLANIAFDEKHILATYPYNPPTPLVYVFTAAGRPKGAIEVHGLKKHATLDLRAFIMGDGSDIFAIDLSSGMTFRYAMP